MDFSKRNINKTNRNDSVASRTAGGGGVTIIQNGGSSSLAEAKKEFLSKKTDDNAEGIINFRKGVRILGSLVNSYLKAASEGPCTDEAIMSAKRVKAEFEGLEKKFLRKDIPDETVNLIKFLGGAEFGEFVPGMQGGTGTKIYPDGRIQTRRLEVSGSMTIMDLIINEIHAMAGDFNFSDCGKIEEVTDLGNRTYLLKFEKELPNDVTSLDVNDVLLSIVNDLRVGGEYYSSWFRATKKNTDTNTLEVVLYADDEVPGGLNFPPKAGYNVTRKGNAVLPPKGETNERAQSWLISSREGRIAFLQNVYAPKLKDYNYSLTLGKLPDIDIVKRLALTNQVGLYAQTIVAENFYSVDWNGDLICKTVDRGEWSLAVAQSKSPYRFRETELDYPDGKKYTQLEQHTVFHKGNKWGCIKDMTTVEPSWNCAEWTLLEGDKTFYLDFESTNGWQFHVTHVDTEVKAVVYYAGENITPKLLADPKAEFSWSRITNNEAADTSWNLAHANCKDTLSLTFHDMGAGWGHSYRKVAFICTVKIPDSAEEQFVENRINIKI